MIEDTRSFRIHMPDGSMWAVPVMVIARNRAANYADEFGGDVERSLAKDTLPLFAEDSSEIHDWAANNMNWSDVESHAVKVAEPPPMKMSARQFQEAWVNGRKDIVTA